VAVRYEMRFIEDDGRLRCGDQVFQIAFGSGFKCNSAVWKYIGSSRAGKAPKPAAAEHVHADTPSAAVQVPAVPSVPAAVAEAAPAPAADAQ